MAQETVQVKRPRGRPKGWSPKTGWAGTAPLKALLREDAGEIGILIPVPEVVKIIPVQGKICEDCTEYLTCKKFKGNDGNICDKFVDNFPDIADDDEITESGSSVL